MHRLELFHDVRPGLSPLLDQFCIYAARYRRADITGGNATVPLLPQEFSRFSWSAERGLLPRESTRQFHAPMHKGQA